MNRPVEGCTSSLGEFSDCDEAFLLNIPNSCMKDSHLHNYCTWASVASETCPLGGVRIKSGKCVGNGAFWGGPCHQKCICRILFICMQSERCINYLICGFWQKYFRKRFLLFTLNEH